MKRARTISYRDTPDIDFFQLAKLFEQVGWPDRSKDLGRLARLVQGSTFVASAWEDDRLVGFGRAVSDGASEAYVSAVAVFEAYRRRGVGRELVRRLLAGHDDLAFVLAAPSELAPFCATIGFAPSGEFYRRTRRD